MLAIKSVQSLHERRLFLTFPWKIYRNDPLWVPPLLSERAKVIDPQQGSFFKDGRAELFIAWKDGQPAGTLCLAEDRNNTRAKGFAECMYGFVECIEDYKVFQAMFDFAEGWARDREMRSLYGPYNLDREDSRGLLIEGRDRPPPILCGHHPPYYQRFFEEYGFQKNGEDGLAYAIDIDLQNPRVQRLSRLADRVRQKHPEFNVRGANIQDMEGEIGRILFLQNEGLKHFPEHVPYSRRDIEAMILPLIDLVDTELVLFAEVNGEPAGFLPGVPNFNEVLVHLNGLRYPWDYVRYIRYKNTRPRGIAIKSVVVAPHYWDTGVAILLFDEMARRASARGYRWADLSLTGEGNLDTWPLAHHMGAEIYKRYRFYKKEIC
ncbi:MAG TPA: GNAT family N-acetyltransferase [Anaerolineales bacterium]|nr:GNAT family N-acetyltransferase [Anaerolineales bacterium]